MKCYTSFQELDALGESLAYDYMKKHGRSGSVALDIDGFATEYLKLKVVYADFAEDDKSKLGFLSDGKTPLMVFLDNDSSAVVFPKDTIVLDRYLLRSGESSRRRFTLAHEVGHYVYAKHVTKQPAACFCTDYDGEADYSPEEQQKMFSINESFADRLGAAILMSSSRVRKVLKKHNNSKRVICYDGGIFSMDGKHAIQMMANDLGVSFSAMVIRLRELDLLETRPVEEYITGGLGVGI